MLERYALLFAQASVELSETRWMSVAHDGAPPLDQLSIDKSYASAIGSIKQACILADMDGILPEIDRLSLSMNPPSGVPAASTDVIVQGLGHLESRVRDGLESEFFLHLETRDVPLYVDKPLFGSKVETKFPLAAEDIEEAGKCLALQRPTGCVFHLMRAMDVAVKRLAKRLGVKTVDKEWGKILSDLSGAIAAMPKVNKADQKKRDAWALAYVNLYHVKQAWRNDTLQPKATYTREQAHEVFTATREFMIQLAGLI